MLIYGKLKLDNKKEGEAHAAGKLVRYGPTDAIGMSKTQVESRGPGKAKAKKSCAAPKGAQHPGPVGTGQIKSYENPHQAPLRKDLGAR